MTQITVEIYDENKISFFMELIKSLDFAGITDRKKGFSRSEKKILLNIEQGLKEVKLIEQGKMKSRPAKEFLNEL